MRRVTRAHSEGGAPGKGPHLGGKDLEGGEQLVWPGLPSLLLRDRAGQGVGWGEEQSQELPEGTSPSPFPLPRQ